MQCVECGNELDPKAKFCPECGKKIDPETQPTEETPKVDADPEETPEEKPEETPAEEEQTEEPEEPEETEDETTAEEPEEPDQNDQQDIPDSKPEEEPVKKKWFFTLICGLTIAVTAVLLFMAVIAGDSVSRFLAFSQVCGAVLMLLMHQNVIKLGKNRWLKIVVLLVVLALSAYSVWGYLDHGNSTTVNNPTTTPTTGLPGVTNPTVAPTKTGLPMPYGAADCGGMPYEQLVTELEKAGFTNIRTEAVEDLDYVRSGELNTVATITAAGNGSFARGDCFEPNDEVVIRYHIFQKCQVTIRMEVKENLIFSKYDVNLLINGEQKGTADHGTGKDFTFMLDPGVYALTFASDEYSHVDRDVELLVDCDLEVAYNVSCGRDQVTVEMRYIDRKVPLKSGHIKLDTSASDYQGMIYTDVADSLEDLGFTDITYQVMYDIVWGITPNGSVESVSIGGDRDFVRGQTYPSDSEIIITYHMPKENDPASGTIGDAD